MEISVFVVSPDGVLTDNMVTGPEAEPFFNWEDVENAIKTMGPNAVVFQAKTAGWFTGSPQPVEWVPVRPRE